MIATFIATITAMTVVAIKQRINIFNPVIVLYVGGITMVLALLIFYLRYYLTKEGVSTFSKVFSNGTDHAHIFCHSYWRAFEKSECI